MITKKQKIEIFENTISNLRKKFVPSDKNALHVPRLDKMTEKFRKLPLD
ncbi:MAG: hypothetical protein ACW9XH_03795 [Candidatus Nitrosopumilus sp. bin_32a]